MESIGLIFSLKKEKSENVYSAHYFLNTKYAYHPRIQAVLVSSVNC